MEFITDILTFVQSEEFAAWIGALTALVTAATGLTALTPTRSDNVVVDGMLRALNFIAGNFLKNKNADDA